MAVSKPLRTEFGIYQRFESCALFPFDYQNDREGKINEVPLDRGVKGKEREKTVLVTTPADY